MKQILWSPESAALNVKRPDEEPFWETTRWSLSNTSCTTVNQHLTSWERKERQKNSNREKERGFQGQKD